MNIENLQKTHDLIEKDVQSGRNKFDQAMWAHECGTPACVAGHAAVACGFTLTARPSADPEVAPGDKWQTYAVTEGGVEVEVYDAAKEALDLTKDQAHDMFFDCYTADAYDAMAMLKHAIEHDEVRWPTLEDDDDE